MANESIKGWNIEYEGSLFQVEQNEKGWESANRPPGTRTIILSSNSKQILLTKEVRPEHGAEPDWRLPGGKVADSWEEYAPLIGDIDAQKKAASAGAALEVREEAGIEVNPEDLSLIGVRPCGGKVTWDLWYFVAKNWSEHPDGQDLEEDEEIDTEWVAIDKVKELIMEDKFKEDRTAPVLLRFLHDLKRSDK